MLDYVQEMIDTFPNKEEIKRYVKTPATKHLFEIREVKKLASEKARIFHNIVAKGLFLCKQSRADIQTTIAFLTTWVREPDEDDWKN